MLPVPMVNVYLQFSEKKNCIVQVCARLVSEHATLQFTDKNAADVNVARLSGIYAVVLKEYQAALPRLKSGRVDPAAAP